jgi:hypothetical protein
MKEKRLGFRDGNTPVNILAAYRAVSGRIDKDWDTALSDSESESK